MSETPSTPEPLLLDAKTAAALCSVSRRTWFAWQSAGQIPLPALRRGRVVRWSSVELAAWVVAGCPAGDRWQAMKGRERGQK
jgi:predicted DNA-binding transcriptional regulator AlpA